MAEKTKPKGPSKAAAPAPAKKLYLIRADDVEHFESFTDDETQIACVRIKRGGRIVQIDDNPEGRGLLSSNIRRIVGDKATTRLISGETKID